MALIDDAVTRLIDVSGQTATAANRPIARAEILGVIEDLNLRFNWGVVESEGTVAFAGGYTNHTVSLPTDFGKMRQDGFGEYDSTSACMKVAWTLKDESYFQRAIRGFDTLSVAGTGEGRIWFFVPDGNDGRKRVRVYPAPDAAMTAFCRYYAMLTLENINRLRSVTLLVDGAMARLPIWFKDQQWMVAQKRYESAITQMKSTRKSADVDSRPMPDRRVQQANVTGWSLR